MKKEIIVQDIAKRIEGKSILVIKGNFGKKERYMLDIDISCLHNIINLGNGAYDIIEENKPCFIENMDYIKSDSVEIIGDVTTDNVLNNYPDFNKMYLVSESGYSKIITLILSNDNYFSPIDRNKAEHLLTYREVLKEYYSVKENIVNQSDYENVLNENAKLIDDNAKLIAQVSDKPKELSDIHIERQIPSELLEADVKDFLDKYTIEQLFGEMMPCELFGVYLWSRRTRKLQPDNVEFENALLELGYRYNLDAGKWKDIVWR